MGRSELQKKCEKHEARAWKEFNLSDWAQNFPLLLFSKQHYL
jgi:hypothetical protein